MDIEELAKYYDYRKDSKMMAILTTLDKAKPDYLTSGWIGTLASTHTGLYITEGTIWDKLLRLVDEELVEEKKGMMPEEFERIRHTLIQKQVATESQLKLHNFPRSGYKLSPKGMFLPAYLEMPQKQGLPRLKPAYQA